MPGAARRRPFARFVMPPSSSTPRSQPCPSEGRGSRHGLSRSAALQPRGSRRCRARDSASRSADARESWRCLPPPSMPELCLQPPPLSCGAPLLRKLASSVSTSPAASFVARVRARLPQSSVGNRLDLGRAACERLLAQRGLGELHAQLAQLAVERRSAAAAGCARLDRGCCAVLVCGRWRGRVEHDMREAREHPLRSGGQAAKLVRRDRVARQGAGRAGERVGRAPRRRRRRRRARCEVDLAEKRGQERLKLEQRSRPSAS